MIELFVAFGAGLISFLSPCVLPLIPGYISYISGSSMNELIEKVNMWFEDRNLIAGSTDKDQILKLVQELGELSDHACKGENIKDDLGDMLVVMLNIMKRNDYTIEECLQIAYNDIKDRKGKMIDGIFVKEVNDKS